MTKTKGGTRPVMTYVPVATALLGITIVLTSVVFFFVEDDIRRLLFVTLGLGILIGSVWYAANPFLKNSRRYVPLRDEVDDFIQLVRVVNRQAVDGAPADELEGTRKQMHDAVDRMMVLAGKGK